MDVRLELRDIADVELLPGWRHDLHHANRAHRAPGTVVQRRLLITLSGHQQVIEVVLRPVLPEQADHRLELPTLGIGRGVLRVLDVLEIAAFDGVSEGVALWVPADPAVGDFPETGILLAKRDRQCAAGPHSDIRVHLDISEHPAPELSQIVVDDGDRGKAGVDHLEDVVVFEDVGGDRDHHWRLAARLQLGVQADEALVIDAPFADEDLLAGQIVHGDDRRRSRPRHHDFAHVGPRRLREGDQRLPLGGDGDHGGDHVHFAARERGVELIARHWHEHDVDLEVSGFQVRVQIVLEQFQGLVRQPPLLPVVDEVMGAVERHPHANRATLDHFLVVAGERLVQHELYGFGEGVVRRGCCRDGRLVCRRVRELRCRRLSLLTGARRGGRGDQQCGEMLREERISHHFTGLEAKPRPALRGWGRHRDDSTGNFRFSRRFAMRT